jgi:antitoxin HigA-1
LGLSITKAAETLGVTRLTLSNLVNGRNGISPEMSIRLAKAFGGSPEVWLGMQMDYDLAQALKKAASIVCQAGARAGSGLATEPRSVGC